MSDGGALATIAELRREGRDRLSASRAAVDSREATLLLATVLGQSEARLLARSEQPVDDRHCAAYRALIARRASGEPVAYLLGEREFYGRTFAVDPRVLIPRPETEHLVEIALELFAARTATILDVGTGSGCIAITLALESSSLSLLASDRSLDALAVARANRRRLAPGRSILWLAADLLEGFELGGLDAVVSNPPYLSPDEAGSLATDVRDHEPHGALFAPPDGLDHLRRLVAGSRGLRTGARLIVEVGTSQAPAVAELAGNAFAVERIERDYAGHERVVCLRRR
ncbi:MAG TPA: peptide chain release factor N(5)-glutamine methyltransferase [Thermoanaerobaculia bacterium]|nr:peptide chain release factor N(5)-glutamine methyltransferase [Thermoanaerobaculia bacterium]